MRSRRTGDGRSTQSDKLLAQRLYRTFEHQAEHGQVRGIQFYVHNGTVTLYGTVRHDMDRDHLTASVRQVPGVKGVIERLQVVAPHYQEVTSEFDKAD